MSTPAANARWMEDTFLMVLPKEIADGRRPGGQAHARPPRSEAASNALPMRHQALQDRGSRVRLHGVVDTRERQRAEDRTIVLLHAIHVEDEARGGRTRVGQVLRDLWGHRTRAF